MDNTKRFTLKIIIIGEAAVGKTSLVKRFVSGQFTTDYRSSIGTNIFTKKIALENKTEITLQLWDIAGQERWINMRRPYYSGAKGVIIVGDLARLNTFDQIEKFWVPDLNRYCSAIPIILIANKSDLSYEIEKRYIESLGERINTSSIIFTSAKSGDNVELAFKLIAQHVINYLY
ncbi:MAG: GTP-binding protein [Candidatus Lokiarchaeota archaeon]|nr:GTP-binding protein [Candidatus Lokiarchaeota archaeon]